MGGTGELAVSVKGLTKSYGDLTAVGGIDLEIPRGQVFALLGPNGAGKTTTVEILEGFRHRDGGEVAVLGLDPDHQPVELRRQIGVVLQSTGVEPYLTVNETVTVYAGYYPHPRPVEEVLELVGLTEQRRERVSRLSGGQQRRLDVAVALAGDPELLFLDEPTTGFDPSARRDAWEVIRGLRSLGKTVLLTTHYMDEAQYLADDVAVIAGGRIVARGTPDTLGGRDRLGAVVRFSLAEGAAPPETLGAVATGGGWWQVTPADVTASLHALTSWSLEERVELVGLQVSRPSLEDVYLTLTHHPGDEGSSR